NPLAPVPPGPFRVSEAGRQGRVLGSCDHHYHMIGKGPDRKRRSGPFREYRTCVLGASALSTYVFLNSTQMCGRSASRPRRREVAHLRAASAKWLIF
ncbi:unnamed protein product, partial [Staurois parvus]